MIGQRHLGGLIAVLLVFAVFLTCFVMAGAEDSILSETEVSTPDYTSLFDKNAVMNINIDAEEKDFQEMLDNARKEEYIKCNVTVNGTKVQNVGIRPKGNSSLSMIASSEDTDRYSFKLEFDHYVDHQTLKGLDKMVINNIQSDTTYMKEYLSYDLMSQMEVPTPLFAYANVTVNGKPWGFYLAVESLEDSFALRNYGTGYGMFYKPEGMGERGSGKMNDTMEKMQDRERSGEDTEQTQKQMPQKPGNIIQDQDNAIQNKSNVIQGQGNAMPDKDSIAQDKGNAMQFPDNGDGAQHGVQRDGPKAGNFREGAGGPVPGGADSGNGVNLVYQSDDPDDYSDIFDNAVFKANKKDYAKVIKALKNLNDGTELDKYINVDEVLRYFAVNTFIVNLDHYASNMGHNYYLYEKDGQLAMLPWDYNMAFGGFQPGNASSAVNFPIDTPVSGVELADRPMIGKLLGVQEYKEKYHEYLQQICDEYFDKRNYENKLDQVDSLIGNYVKKDSSAFYTYDQYRSGLEALETFGQLRAESVRAQLSGTIPPTSKGQSSDSSALIDAAGLDMSAMGSMGGGKGGPGRDRGKKTFSRPVPDGEDFRSRDEAPDLQAGADDALQNAAGIWTTDDPSLIKTAIVCAVFQIAALLFAIRFRRRRFGNF